MRAFFNLGGRALILTLLLISCNEEVSIKPCVEGNGTIRFQIDENSPAGALVGKIPVNAPDQMRFFIYEGNTDNTFGINIFDGRIHVRDNSMLDYEKHREFQLTVVAQSPQCITSIVAVTIQISDLKE